MARRYVMLAYDVRADCWTGERADAGHRVADDLAAAPGGLGRRPGDGAARDVHRIMDELYELGARAILVTDIHACRL